MTIYNYFIFLIILLMKYGGDNFYDIISTKWDNEIYKKKKKKRQTQPRRVYKKL